MSGAVDLLTALLIIAACAAALLVGSAAPYPGAVRDLALCAGLVVAALVLRVILDALDRRF